MMNTAIIRRIIYFGLGVGVGVAATNRHYRLKYEDIAMDEIDSVREMYDRTHGSGMMEDECLDNVDTSNQPVDVGISEDYLGEDYDELVEDYKTADIGMSKLYPIDDETFLNTPTGYEVITLEFYEVDEVLTEDGERIDDAHEILGYWDVNTLFLEYEDGADTAYVRNEILKIDYEVVRIDDSYEEGDAHLNEAYDE